MAQSARSINIRELNLMKDRVRRQYGMRRYSKEKQETLNEAISTLEGLVGLPNAAFSPAMIVAVNSLKKTVEAMHAAQKQ